MLDNFNKNALLKAGRAFLLDRWSTNCSEYITVGDFS